MERGIWYADLTRAPWPAIDSAIGTLAAADGVIFDLRGYPAGNHYVLRHLLDGPDTSRAWMRIPQFVYPDRQPPVGYELVGWGLQPLQPHIGGRVAFLTDARAISYAESVMGLVEHYRLGEIVGQPTAGANGNVNPLMLPGGFEARFTGMRVVRHDGSQHHLLDEVLETALEVARGNR